MKNKHLKGLSKKPHIHLELKLKDFINEYEKIKKLRKEAKLNYQYVVIMLDKYIDEMLDG